MFYALIVETGLVNIFHILYLLTYIYEGLCLRRDLGLVSLELVIVRIRFVCHFVSFFLLVAYLFHFSTSPLLP